VEQRSTGLDPYGRLRNVERGEAILRAIEELPEDFRELIALRHFAGLSYEEIATVKDMCRSGRSRTNSFAPEPY
jgi:DNA-directed RNA polymerase specialized sigma24 family protein